MRLQPAPAAHDTRIVASLPFVESLARRMAALKAEAKDKGYFIVPLWEQAFRIGELLLMPAIAFALLNRREVVEKLDFQETRKSVRGPCQ